LLFLIVLIATPLLFADETPIPASPTRWVTDTANFLSPEVVQSLDARLAGYQQATGHQLIVYIAPTTGDAPIEDWAVRAFAKWKVGRKGIDDGLAVFIMTQDHKMRIEVGYGLEAVVPDAIASRVIREVMAPRIQAGDHDDAVTGAIGSLIGVIGGEADALPTPRSPEPAVPWWVWFREVIAEFWLFEIFVLIPLLQFIVSRIRHTPFEDAYRGTHFGWLTVRGGFARGESGGSDSSGSSSGGSDSGGFDGGGGAAERAETGDLKQRWDQSKLLRDSAVSGVRRRFTLRQSAPRLPGRASW
jgi:uncharacterized protein